MSARSTVLAACVLAFALVVVSGAAAKKPLLPPPPPPSGDASAPSTPTNLRITATTPTSISLAWDASSDNSSNWWYCVQTSPSGCFRVDPPQTTFTYPYLWPGTTYSFSVVAIDANGNRSGSSNTVSYTTPPDTTPPTAPTLTATSVFPIRVSLSWTASVDDATQVYYTLLVDGSPYLSGQIGSSEWTVLDLAPSTSHVFQVTARDYFGNTSESNVVSVTTPAATDTVPPSAPTNLRLSSESTVPEIWLDWDQSTDDADPQSQIMYDVYLNGEPEHAAIGSGETILYCRGEGPNTITVTAVDTSGNVSAFSNEIVFC